MKLTPDALRTIAHIASQQSGRTGLRWLFGESPVVDGMFGIVTTHMRRGHQFRTVYAKIHFDPIPEFKGDDWPVDLVVAKLEQMLHTIEDKIADMQLVGWELYETAPA